MVIQSGEYGVTLDTGVNRIDSKLQHLTAEGWQDYLESGEPKLGPIDISTLPAGKYRYVSPDV